MAQAPMGTLKSIGATPAPAPKAAPVKASGSHPANNLGKYLHPKKGR